MFFSIKKDKRRVYGNGICFVFFVYCSHGKNDNRDDNSNFANLLSENKKNRKEEDEQRFFSFAFLFPVDERIKLKSN
jgi:hypothetical protein